MKTGHGQKHLALLAAILAAGMLSACGRRESAPLPASTPAAAVNATNPSSPAAVSQPDIKKLTGKWLRPDGGYVLDIRAATEDGKLDAGYFNPNPIHVAQATWRHSKEIGLVVFVELRDANYPGSTYRLVYNPTTDSFSGVYFQAALQQNFDVVFERLKQ